MKWLDFFKKPLPRRVESIGNLSGGQGKDLGFVVVYFNYCGYAALRRNMLDFLCRWEWMEGRMLVVELAFGDAPFELTGKAANLLQLRSDSVMWQKEALINAGTKVLRERGFENVGWLDGDSEVVGCGEEWYYRLSKMLRRRKLVQVFESIELNFDDFSRKKLGALAEYMTGAAPVWQCHTAGLGWAVRGAVWDRCGWYDLGVAGSGDRLMFVGSIGGVDNLHTHAEMWGDGNKHLAVYERWVAKWRREVGGSVDYMPGVLARVAPHGASRDRAYRERADGLVALGFDPARDVTRDGNGVLEWTPEASDELKSYLESYFSNRKEDG